MWIFSGILGPLGQKPPTKTQRIGAIWPIELGLFTRQHVRRASTLVSLEGRASFIPLDLEAGPVAPRSGGVAA